VHRPKILQLTGVAESEAPALTEAFFAGVDSHERAAPIWKASLDESV
jgi:truncated hemoglobin YjbI